MPIAPFKLERYYALYEFKARIMLSSSDCESLSMAELLDMASPDSREMWNALKLGYTETQGNPYLRGEASNLYTHISPDNILIAAPEELIYIAMQTLLQPGDHVISLAPAYQSLYSIASSMGCNLSFWKQYPSKNGWLVDPDELEKLVTPHTRLLVINFPNNPTGLLPTLEEYESILRFAGKHGLTVFCDEMYRLLEYSPAHRLPSVSDVYEKGISLSGLSKSMALPGLRIGWLATQNSTLVEKWMAFKDYTTICNSAPSEILGLIALQNKDRLVSRNLEIIRGNLNIFQDVLTRHAHQFKWHAPSAGSIAFPEWKGKTRVENFCQDMLDRYSVMIVPGSLFDHPGNFFRLGLGRKNFAEGIGYLEKYLSE